MVTHLQERGGKNKTTLWESYAQNKILFGRITYWNYLLQMIYLGWRDMIILHKCLFYALGVFLFLYHEKNEVCWCFIFLIWMNGCGPWNGVLMQFLFLWSFSLIYFASVWSKQVIRSSVLHWVGRNLNESGQLPFGFHMSFPKGTSWSPIVIKKKKSFCLY